MLGDLLSQIYETIRKTPLLSHHYNKSINIAQQQRLPFARLQALVATSSYRDSSSTNSEISTIPSKESAGTKGEPSTRGPNELRRKRTNKSNQQKPRMS